MKKNILIKGLLIGVMGSVGAVAEDLNDIEAIYLAETVEDRSNDSGAFYIEATGFNTNTTWHGESAGELGGFNAFIGSKAGKDTTGWRNTFVGASSGIANTTGAGNTFIGEFSGAANTTGSRNVVIGEHTGDSFTGSGNVFLGKGAAGNLVDVNNTLYIENGSSDTPLIYGEFDNDLVRVNGNLEAIFNGSNIVNDGLSTLTLLSANNTEVAKSSDAGFGLLNNREGFQWNFRTYGPSEGFTATKLGTGGGEFIVGSLTNDFHDATVVVGGVTIFENGHLVTASSRELKTDIKPLDTQAALDAFHALKPVSYAYKAHKDEPVVGFIAEDVPSLVSMPSGKSIDSTEIVAVLTSVLKEQEKQLKVQAAKIERLETMQKRLTRVESLLTNLALETSNLKTEKVSLNK